MEPPLELLLVLLDFIDLQLYLSDILLYLLLAILLLTSALISGSEVAFFSINPMQKKELDESDSTIDKLIQTLLLDPKKLLATILISNNFVNIAILVFSSFLIERMAWMATLSELVVFLIQVVVVTF